MQASQLQQQRTRVDECVEFLCEQGCMKVSGYIEDLQQNRAIPELDMLSYDERIAVLDELVSIMSVYNGKCTP